jgi:hypothetical protein
MWRHNNSSSATTTWWEIIYISFICQAHSHNFPFFLLAFFSPRCWLASSSIILRNVIFCVLLVNEEKGKISVLYHHKSWHEGVAINLYSFLLRKYFFLFNFVNLPPSATCFLSDRHIALSLHLSSSSTNNSSSFKQIEDEKSICEIRCAQKGERIKRNLITHKNELANIFYMSIFRRVFLVECLLFVVE